MHSYNKLNQAVRLALALGVTSTALFATAVSAQQAEEVKAKSAETALTEEKEPERIVVTGSRIQRAEFSNASPIQIVSGDISRELGLMDTTSMLQSTNQASGLQIDNSFGGFVLDNGPGASTIGFRGLGADRTLVLINGRRMAPAGVGGAPSAPDLNLIPGVMVQRVENLFDGASTVYGSDAVAGVANVILKKDIEGFEFTTSYRQPKGSGGQEKVLSAMWGTTMDNGFITVGAELSDTQAQSRAGYAFAQGCTERIFESEDGRIITRSTGYGPSRRGDVDKCDAFPLTNRIFIGSGNFFGSIYSTPGTSNINIPGFSENSAGAVSLAGRFPNWVAADSDYDGINDFTMIDGNGDGFNDVDLLDPRYAFQESDTYRSGDYIRGQERASVMLNGEYGFGDANDTNVYYEALWAKRDSPTYRPGAQFFLTVGANNPFNPCGTYGINCESSIGRPKANQTAQPILNIHGDRDREEVEVSQYRSVVGVTASLPGLESLGLNNWYYDIYGAHSASSGDDVRQGIHQGRLDLSLNTSRRLADGSVVCGTGSDGCVPVNLFASNLYEVGGGRFTDAEAKYLFVDRIMKTEVAQTVFSGFVGGDIFELPWNNEAVPMIVGAEYRKDRITTNANDIATEGLLHNYFSDKGADGSRDLKEYFIEAEFPLIKGMPAVEELTFIASGRNSKESFYDGADTYSLKTVYRPVDWVTLRGTKGTSYRAPNLRERFLNGTTGFGSFSDPCVVPDAARISDPLNPNVPVTYDASKDTREAATLQSCVANGVDPTKFGLGGNGTSPFTAGTSVELNTGGSISLKEETSVAQTYGFVIDQPFSEEFKLTLSMTRFDIEVTNSISEPGAGYSLAQCFTEADGNRKFCDRIERDPITQRLSMIDQSFINIGLETSKGVDYNVYFQQDYTVFEKNLDISVDLQATKMTESLYDVLGTVDDNLGEPTVPEWRASALFIAKYDNYRFSWQSRFIGDGELDSPGNFVANSVACRGMTTAAGAPLKCRPLSTTENYTVHNASLGYTQDNYEVSVGVRNVFNDAPPKADGAGVFSANNIPLGVGYEQPRSLFLNFNMKL